MPFVIRTRLLDYKAEQADELEALQSIYPDEYEEISDDPVEFSIRVEPDEQDGDDICKQSPILPENSSGNTYGHDQCPEMVHRRYNPQVLRRLLLTLCLVYFFLDILQLIVKYTETYPETLPEFSIDVVEGELEQEDFDNILTKVTESVRFLNDESKDLGRQQWSF